MMVYGIRRGSFEITWLVILPPAIATAVRSQKAIEFFKQFRVTSISIDGVQIYQEHTHLQAETDISDTSSGFSIDSGVGSMSIGASGHSADVPRVGKLTFLQPPPTSIYIDGLHIYLEHTHLQAETGITDTSSGFSIDSGVGSMSIGASSSSADYSDVPWFGKPTPDTPRSTHLLQRQRTSDKKLDTAKPENVLFVQCHEKNSAPVKMIRESATSDDQFAYFTPYDSYSLYQYEYTTEKWETLPQCPYRNSGLATINNEFTTVGGYDRLDESHRTKLMTLRQREWVEEYPPMKTGCSSPTVVTTSDGNYLFVIGGRVAGRVAKVELLQLKTREWYTVTDLPEPLSYPSATICGDQLNVIGGGNGFSCSLQDLPITSPLLLSWTPLPPLPVEYSTAATLCGQLVLIGGAQGISPVNSIHQLVGGWWMKIGSMAKRRWRCLVTNQSPDKILIVGGYGALDSIEECTAVVV